jgi:hypothetical protein
MTTKINTDYIKKNVACWNCDSSDLKRRHKQTFKSPLDENLELNEQKIHWRQFECEKCHEITNVTNTEETLLSKIEEAVLPFSVFDYCIEMMDNQINLALFYKPSVKGEVVEDDVRDEHILLFNEFFSKHNIKAANSMENYWEIMFNKEHYDFETLEDGIKIIKDLILTTGATYSKELEQADELECSEFNVRYLFF